MNRNSLYYPMLLACLLICYQACAADSDNSYSGTVVETMNSGGYTYVRIDTGSEKIWAAGPETDIKAGDKVSISREMPMPGYHSNSLERDFDVLYFVGGFAREGDGSPQNLTQAHADASSQVETGPVPDIKKAEDGKTIEEIIDQQAQLVDQQVRVRGKVVKYNPNIMGRDWIHIRDSSTGENFTITGDVDVALGNVILAEGKIVLNKDFGYGYVYEIIMEDAEIIVEEE